MQYPELIFALLVIVVMAAILITLFVVVLMGNSKLKSDLLKETYRALGGRTLTHCRRFA